MNFNPHSLHQILIRIREQMRCPQCGTKVGVDFPSIKVAGEDFILLQLKCETCSAFIVLHVNVNDPKKELLDENGGVLNASTHLSVSEEDMHQLKHALKASAGSFEKLFQSVQPRQSTKAAGEGSKPDLPSAFV